MNRRNLKRRHLMFLLRVLDAETGAQLGCLSDITPEGLMMTGELRLTVNRTYQLQMRLPPSGERVQVFEFAATVAWVDDNVHPLFVDTGFRDLDLTEAQRATLAELIEEFELHEDEAAP